MPGAHLRAVEGDFEDKPEQFSIGSIEYDHRKQQLVVNGESRRLTTKENELFYLLVNLILIYFVNKFLLLKQCKIPDMLNFFIYCRMMLP